MTTSAKNNKEYEKVIVELKEHLKIKNEMKERTLRNIYYEEFPFDCIGSIFDVDRSLSYYDNLVKKLAEDFHLLNLPVLYKVRYVPELHIDLSPPTFESKKQKDVFDWLVERIPVTLESAIEKYAPEGFSTFLIGRVDVKNSKDDIKKEDNDIINKLKTFDELRSNRRFFERLKRYFDLRFGEGMLLRAGYRPFMWGEPHGVYLADLWLDWTSVTRVQNDNVVCQKAYKEMQLFDRYFPFETKNE